MDYLMNFQTTRSYRIFFYLVFMAVLVFPGASVATPPEAEVKGEKAALRTTINTRGNPGNPHAPFGWFYTPRCGSTVKGSIAVTGWALDDVEVDNVKIYNSSTYIGDAVFVEGARPDVAQNYPGYPNNTRAGWGYMLLTNFLPGGGNGTYTLHAIARDSDENETFLGSRTIHCDNANAVKPFGAIDTPIQGGTASGSSYINWGWALTPSPNAIPSDGSTINVYVDGVNVGHPEYNQFRSDIAELFPGYANSEGAAGYFILDTTAYANGVHTIAWSARDNAGNTDGIGSRYFIIQPDRQRNRGTRGPASTRAFEAIPADYTTPVQVLQGYDESAPLVTMSPSSGVIWVLIKETERIEIRLNESGFQGCSHVNNQAEALPAGSTLDSANGIFYWIPGPGFLGEYELVFVREAGGRAQTKKVIKVIINPMQEDPSPAIFANGQGFVLNVGSSDPVSISVTLDPKDFPGMEVDYWLLAETGTVFTSYTLTGGWGTGIAPLGRAGLISIPTAVEVFSSPSLGSDTTFYFAISTPTLSSIWFSSVQVNID